MAGLSNQITQIGSGIKMSLDPALAQLGCLLLGTGRSNNAPPFVLKSAPKRLRRIAMSNRKKRFCHGFTCDRRRDRLQGAAPFVTLWQ